MTGTGRSLVTSRRDGMLVLAALVVVATGTLTGWPMAIVAATVATLPVVGFLMAGHIPGRGGAVGCLAMGLAATLIRPETGAAAWGSLAMLAGIGLAAMLAGAQADGMAAARGLVAAEPAGRWVTIVVQSEGPSGGVARPVRPRVSPHPAPERRALSRLAGERRRGRRPVSVHVG